MTLIEALKKFETEPVTICGETISEDFESGAAAIEGINSWYHCKDTVGGFPMVGDAMGNAFRMIVIAE